MRSHRRVVAWGAALCLLASACTGTPNPEAESRVDGHAGTHATGHATATGKPATASAHGSTSAPPKAEPAPLRAGEEMRRAAMPATYLPEAPNGGTDDYRCFLLDPEVDADSFVTGYDVIPGDVSVVHHVILYRVAPDNVRLAEAQDDESAGDGWTCFGGTGLERQGASLDDAP